MHVIIALLQCPRWQSTGGGWGVGGWVGGAVHACHHCTAAVSSLAVNRGWVGGAVHACHHCTAAVSSLAISVSFISTSSPLARVIIVSRSALGKIQGPVEYLTSDHAQSKTRVLFFYLRQDHVHQ